MTAPPSRSPASLPVVAVLGLGYVGAAMAVAVASARNADSDPVFRVLGVDRATREGEQRVASLNAGRFPFATTDGELLAAVAEATEQGLLRCGTDTAAMADASVVVIDVGIDIDWRADRPELQAGGFEAAIRDVGRHVSPGALVLVETTVPPGTTQKVVCPLLAEELSARGLDPRTVHVAHSYERVMPGPDYLSSITRYWRVYAGSTPEAADAAERFLTAVIDTQRFPLTRLADPTASETAKVLENAYRATTIALMDEWSRFAELVGVDLFEIVEAIRLRPTHANMRTPGFGVGGYCITKDPLFADVAARELWGEELEFPVSRAAVRINDDGPLAVCDRLVPLLGGTLRGRRVLLAGVSYRSDVADTRWSPSETFVRAVREAGAEVVVHDPLVDHWVELDMDVTTEIPDAADFDAVVFAVPHGEYRDLDIKRWLDGSRPVLCDAFDVLSATQRTAAEALGATMISVGRGPRPIPPSGTRA